MNRLLPLLVLLLLPFLHGCGGGTTDQYADGGIGGTGVSDGSVSGFGSVFVNGVEFDTASASIVIDGQDSTEADLRVGQYVTVKGQFDPPQADSIHYFETIKGPIDSLNPLRVLGQDVLVDNGTVFDNLPNGLLDLAVGDVVEISGPRNSMDQVVAGYIEKLAATPTRYTVIGKAVNADATGFEIGQLKVSYPNSSPLNEQILRVKGDPASYTTETGALFSTMDGTDEETFDTIMEAADVEAEIEGIITDFTNATTFSINHIPVDATAAIYEQGVPADLGLDVEIEVEGIFNDQNVLVADKIIIEKESRIILYGDVTATDTLNNSLTLMGKEIFINTDTQMKDESPAEIKYFDLGDIQIGNQIEVRAFMDAGQLIANRVERDDADIEEAFVQGPVDAGSIDKTNFWLDILGIRLNTDSGTSFEGMTRTAFFDAVNDGDIVRGHWNNFTDINLPVDEMEFED